MSENFSLIDETLGYLSAPEKTNTDPRHLVAPSQNVIIDRNRKVRSRLGYTRLGASNTALAPVRNSWTWFTSTGTELLQRFYDDELEVWIASLDGVAINAWNRVRESWSTTKALRAALYWDATENEDFQIMVNGDDDLYRWNGAVAVISSGGTNTLTKKGTNTWAQNRFYVSGNKVVINTRTGVEFTYTGGETTATLTSVTPDPAVADIVANDVFVQKVVTNANTPEANRNNHTIFGFENQIIVGSEDANEVFISKNTDYTSYTFSAPRAAGEGGLLTLDGISKGFGAIGKVLISFAGKNSIFKTEYQEIAVSTTLAEVIKTKRLNIGSNLGSFSPDTIVQLGNAIIYLSNEPALRYFQDPEQLEGSDPKTLSNPIKPDFDNEDFTNPYAIWHKNALHLSSSVNSRLYILEFVEDADGKLRRFWQAPQILPVRAMAIFDGKLHIHSNAVPETYELFAADTYSDTASDDSKLPIHCIAAFAYTSYRKRFNQKNFDEYVIEGEISPSTNDLLLTLNYGFGGFIQSVDRFINGTDQSILQETLLTASLGQQPLGQQPLGGFSPAPDNTAKFRVIKEYSKEDFEEIQAIFSTNETDRYWAIIAHGANAKISRRQNVSIKQ